MAQKPSKIREFQKRFPDEDSCLTHLMRTRFGERFTCFKCQKEATYYRVKGRRSFECEHCGYQVYPTAGTPFEKTRTSLRCQRRRDVAAVGRSKSAARTQARRPPILGAFLLVAFYS
jgi:transposase-like zinc ribbon protein